MYNVKAVTEAMRGLIGFRPHNDEDIDPIDADLNESRSGLYLDKAHALITAKVLANAAVVLTNDEQTPIVGEAPPSNPISRLIRNTLDDAVAAVLSAVRTRKLLRFEGKSLLGKTKLYEGEGAISDLIQPADRFVALQIVTNDTELAVGKLSFGIQLTGPAPALRIYTISGNGDRVLAKTVATTFAGRMQWFDTDIILAGETSYKVGYYESDLPSGVQAIRRSKTIGNIPCGGCEPENTQLWGRWKPYFTVSAVRQDSDDAEFDTMENQNFGINLAFSVGCDIGGLLIDQQAQLAEAIRQQAVVILLNEIAFSQQVTTIEQQVRQNAKYALESTEEAKLTTLLDALDIDFSGLSPRCLPDTRAVGMVKRTTVFRR